jgi:crotonobetainyl-CoA:carnitine CoA-transferase CaiB-like acyl-CoA transferase
MPYTDQQLQALRDALANGARRVRFADREIEYRSIDELKAAIAAAEAELAKDTNTPVTRQIRVSTQKGF